MLVISTKHVVKYLIKNQYSKTSIFKTIAQNFEIEMESCLHSIAFAAIDVTALTQTLKPPLDEFP